MLDRGINVGLATTARTRRNALNMLLAMRLRLTYGAFATSRDRWLGAARRCGWARSAAPICLAYRAAAASNRARWPIWCFSIFAMIDFVPLTDAINQIVTCADTACITDVMANGRFVLRDGRIAPVNMPDLRERVGAAVERLKVSVAGARTLPRGSNRMSWPLRNRCWASRCRSSGCFRRLVDSKNQDLAIAHGTKFARETLSRKVAVMAVAAKNLQELEARAATSLNASGTRRGPGCPLAGIKESRSTTR